MRSTQYQASEQASVSATELSSQSLATDDSDFTTDNKMLMKKLSTKCRKADARIDQLEKDNVSLKEQRDSAVARSRELRVESESFKSEIRDCKATIEQFEEENDDLQSELETSEEKVEQLEQDLANPRKSYRIRS
jgi:predicted RNase H-like nuclease (RuvC/YqgF family)